MPRIRNSFIDYSSRGSTGPEAAGTARPADGATATPGDGLIGAPPSWQTRKVYTTDAAYEIAKVLEGVGRNAAISHAETGVLQQKIGNVTSRVALEEVRHLIADALSTSLVAPKDRDALVAAVLDANAALGQHLAVTKALGEDIFGMAPRLNPVEKRILSASANDVIVPYEAKQIAAAFEKIDDTWSLSRAFEATRAAVNANLITVEDRVAIAGAFHEAAARIGDGFRPVTRATNEDVFGVRPFEAVNDLVTKAAANGTLGKSEMFTIGLAVDSIGTKDQLQSAFDAVSKAVSRNLVAPSDRRRLEKAFLEADARLGGGVLPSAPGGSGPSGGLGQDLFGGSAAPLRGVQRRVYWSAQDSVITSKEAGWIAARLGQVKTEAEFVSAYPAVRQAVSSSSISKQDRAVLLDAVMAASAAANTPLMVTRALGEDIFGMAPKV
jgi:hypothetical protein